MNVSRFTLALVAGTALAVTAAEAKYKETDVTDGGSVQGAVMFDGAIPELPTAEIAKDNEVCGDGSIIPNPVTIGAGGELEHVVVYLEEVKEGKAWPEQDYALDQQECAFEPYLQVVPKGVEMTIKNSDPVLHNVHPFEIVGDKRRTLFNLAQPQQDQTNTKKIKTRKGNAVELACDAHAWMAGWLYVLEHPYYAVVGADGTFEIGDIPPGDYKLVAWHPVLGVQEQDLEVAAGGAADASFQFTAN